VGVEVEVNKFTFYIWHSLSHQILENSKKFLCMSIVMNRLTFFTIFLCALFIYCEKDMTSIRPKPEESPALTGQVLEMQSGTPVAGALVKLLINMVEDTTDNSGSFRIRGLTPGEDTLVVAVPGYLILQEVVQINEGSQSVILRLISVLTRVTLQNQTEHSGIMVELVELDTFTVTDSTGAFLFKDVANGEYTLKAGYPYFAFASTTITVQGSSIQTPVDLELQQLLQFWVEPHEITLSIDSLSTIEIILYVENITDSIVSIGGYTLPEFFNALEPQGFNWPLINYPEFCQRVYGTFVNGDIPYPPGGFIPPNTVTSFNVSLWINNIYGCLLVGDYLLFMAYTDLSRFPKYFDSRYIWNDSDPLQPVYEKMNRSIYKKRELFRPARVHITQ
jgi:hypothetical protein